MELDRTLLEICGKQGLKPAEVRNMSIYGLI
jgi:hypothetical protein